MNQLKSLPFPIWWLGWFLVGVLLVFLVSGTVFNRGAHGEISGIVQLMNQPRSEGIQIYIPGTQYRAVTDAGGSFLITGLAAGDSLGPADPHARGFRHRRQAGKRIVQRDPTTLH